MDAPNIPSNYQKPFNINTKTRQDKFGNPSSLNLLYNTKHYYLGDSSYKRIAIPPHVNLNLLYTSVNSSKKNGYLSVSTTMRVKNKFATYIYYKPL
jgi:hypothetical protein